MLIKKNRPKIALRAAPEKDGAVICAIDSTAAKEVIQVKGDWQYVRVKVGKRSCMGWVKT
ncbi:hypothetical protein AGMMS49992_25420 [Clostridia bacterium]|nr:hypothetical protein AGMMS49992_25420 [Clostridia bacterium]